MKGPTSRQRHERKMISFLNYLFLPSAFLVLFFLLFLASFPIFPSASAIRKYPVLILQTPLLTKPQALRGRVRKRRRETPATKAASFAFRPRFQLSQLSLQRPIRIRRAILHDWLHAGMYRQRRFPSCRA